MARFLRTTTKSFYTARALPPVPFVAAPIRTTCVAVRARQDYPRRIRYSRTRRPVLIRPDSPPQQQQRVERTSQVAVSDRLANRRLRATRSFYIRLPATLAASAIRVRLVALPAAIRQPRQAHSYLRPPRVVTPAALLAPPIRTLLAAVHRRDRRPLVQPILGKGVTVAAAALAPPIKETLVAVATRTAVSRRQRFGVFVRATVVTPATPLARPISVRLAGRPRAVVKAAAVRVLPTVVAPYAALAPRIAVTIAQRTRRIAKRAALGSPITTPAAQLAPPILVRLARRAQRTQRVILQRPTISAAASAPPVVTAIRVSLAPLRRWRRPWNAQANPVLVQPPAASTFIPNPVVVRSAAVATRLDLRRRGTRSTLGDTAGAGQPGPIQTTILVGTEAIGASLHRARRGTRSQLRPPIIQPARPLARPVAVVLYHRRYVAGNSANLFPIPVLTQGPPPPASQYKLRLRMGVGL